MVRFYRTGVGRMLSGLGIRPHERSPELAWLLNSEVKEP
jgi:hypothetical protein